MVDCLIWDAGGTLFDTYPAVVAACQSVLKVYGIGVPEPELMALFRTTTDSALDTLAARYDLDREVFGTQFEAAYDDVPPEVQPPFAGVVDVCAYVVERGARNLIVTHRGRASLAGLLRAHGMGRLFSDAITGDDPYPRKPDPTSLLVLASRHGLEPGRCLAIGDRGIDVQAGRSAGMVTCCYGGACRPQIADFAIAHYEELCSWLRRKGGT
jgi:HAD superfamily hydrolase (TIGR01509 family)